MSEALLAALWRASWQGGLAVAVLWCFCRALEKRRWFSADLRCWLWRAAYLKLLISLAVSGSIVLPILPAAKMPEPPSVVSPSPPATNEDATIRSASLDTVSALLPPAVSATSPLLSWQETVLLFYLLGVGVCLVRVIRAGL
ncbi:MAG: hypothetical protein H7Z41_07480, partial [Cytophagales bacterium]|nr:hypothetical protein [Armatimonadota bacterium]